MLASHSPGPRQNAGSGGGVGDNLGMSLVVRHPSQRRRLPTWDDFKRAIRRVDRDTLLVQAAAATAQIDRDGLSDELSKYGLIPWIIADVARTAVAWSGFQRPEADGETLLRLCNMNVQLADEEAIGNPRSTDRLGRVLSRLYFEQFPPQHAVMPEVSRTLLLFGSAAEFPSDFTPTAMTPGWFERLTGGLSLDEYVEAIFLISVATQQHNGGFSPAWLDQPGYQELSGVFPLEVVRRTFDEHLVTTVEDFKISNRRFQEPAASAEKKFAFNPLTSTPFIHGVAEIPIAPCVQAIIAKASPSAVYHQAREVLGDPFTHELGSVFQHYSGRQLQLASDDREILPEVRYGTKKDSKDSCDWFLDLPGLLVLIECKARQPIESLRTGSADWLKSVQDSIGKGITQLNRSNADIEKISAVQPQIDTSKPRVGLVVTLAPFYVNQNWVIWDYLPDADFPIGVLSIGELESLILLDTGELEHLLVEAAATSQEDRLLLSQALDAAAGRENLLLASTWDSITLFERVTAESQRLRGEAGSSA